jgi:hypothetical protein
LSTIRRRMSVVRRKLRRMMARAVSVATVTIVAIVRAVAIARTRTEKA